MSLPGATMAPGVNVVRPGIIEDLLWCLLNPAYGLARLHEMFTALPPVLWLTVLACAVLSVVLAALRKRRRW